MTTAVHGTDHRTCESCGGAMPKRMSRSRDEQGRQVCEQCKSNPQAGWTTSHSALSVVDASEMQRREAEALTSVVRVRKAKHAGLSVVAHDSGDQAIIHHCPFCGSGAVMARSDGTTTCDFCHSAFTVQAQPAHPFMPQTIDGQDSVPPGMPGATPDPSELSAPTDPTVEEDEEGVSGDALGDADPNPPSHPNGPGEAPAGKQQPSPLGPEGDPKADADHEPMPESEDGDHEPAPEGQETDQNGKPKPKKPGGGKPPWLKGSAKQAATAPLCADDFEEAYGFEPDMGMEGVTFEPGTCSRCGRDMIVFTLDSMFTEGRQFRIVTGPRSTAVLDTEAYMQRLAIQHADDRDAVLDTVRLSNVIEGSRGPMPPFVQAAADPSTAAEIYSILRQRGQYLLPYDKASLIGPVKALAKKDGLTVQQYRERNNLLSNHQMRTRPYSLSLTEDGLNLVFPDAHMGARLSDGLVRVQIKAGDLTVGDRLDASGKNRVSKVHTPPSQPDTILAQTVVSGARSPSILRLHRDDNLTVWRKGE